MRTRIYLCLLAVSVALGAVAAADAGEQAKRDGTLAVRSGRGTVVLLGLQGSVIGRIDRGRVTIEDPDPLSGAGPIVRGWDWIKARGTSVTYGGKDVRFRILGGRFTVRIENAVGVDLSIVGQGRVMLKGAGYEELGLSNGEYSLNDSAFLPVPDYSMWLSLKAPPKQPPPRASRP